MTPVMNQFRLSLALILFVLLASVGSAQEAPPPFDVAVEGVPFADFEPSNPDERQFGPFIFKGGVFLSSNNDDFGGFSGMHILEGGKGFIAVSDTGHWMRAEIRRDQSGVPTGIENVRMARLYSGMGRRYDDRKYLIDAEGIAVSNGLVFVAFEAINVISQYPLDLETLQMEPTVLKLPGDIDRLDVNSGLEALAFGNVGGRFEGHLLTIAEGKNDDDAQNTSGWIFKPGGTSDLAGEFKLENNDLFYVTETGFLKNGDLIVLERRFTISTGVGMRIRRVKAANIKADAVLKGKIVFEAGLAHRIDNMEAMSIYENDKGETVLAFLSDDNHSLLQQTIFFEMVLSE